MASDRDTPREAGIEKVRVALDFAGLPTDDAAILYDAGLRAKPDAGVLRAALERLMRACRGDDGVCRLCGVPRSTFHKPGCPVDAAIRVLEPAYDAASPTVSAESEATADTWS